MIFTLLFSFFAVHVCDADESFEARARASAKSKTAKLMEVTGDGDYGDERTAWDKTYSRKDYLFGKDPSEFLRKNIDLLPKGLALDIATGEGRNAVFLAKKGFQVEGVDISVVGLKKAQKLAAENGVKIQTINADLNKYKIRKNHYSVIINFLYLQRSLFPQIKDGLKKGGYVVFEAHTTEQLKNPNSSTWVRDYLLEPGELKKVFSEFHIIHYSEENDGKNALAHLIAKKP